MCNMSEMEQWIERESCLYYAIHVLKYSQSQNTFKKLISKTTSTKIYMLSIFIQTFFYAYFVVWILPFIFGFSFFFYFVLVDYEGECKVIQESFTVNEIIR